MCKTCFFINVALDQKLKANMACTVTKVANSWFRISDLRPSHYFTETHLTYRNFYDASNTLYNIQPIIIFNHKAETRDILYIFVMFISGTLSHTPLSFCFSAFSLQYICVCNYIMLCHVKTRATIPYRTFNQISHCRIRLTLNV